jgi:hypothetical protein
MKWSGPIGAAVSQQYLADNRALIASRQNRHWPAIKAVGRGG